MPIIYVFYSLFELLDGQWEATYNSIDGYNLTEDNAGEICWARSSAKALAT